MPELELLFFQQYHAKIGVPVNIEWTQCLQQIRNKLPYVIIILIEAQPGDTFPWATIC